MKICQKQHESVYCAALFFADGGGVPEVLLHIALVDFGAGGEAGTQAVD